MSYCEKIDCGYWYVNEDEEFPSCHCDLPEGQAPCEVEENYDEGDD